MTADVIDLASRRKPEDQSAVETRLFLANMGIIFADAFIDTAPREMIPGGIANTGPLPTYDSVMNPKDHD